MHETNTIIFGAEGKTDISYQLIAFISLLLMYVPLNWNRVTNWSIFDKHYEMTNLAKGNWKLVLKLTAPTTASAIAAEELMFMSVRHGNNNRLRPFVLWNVKWKKNSGVFFSFVELNAHTAGSFSPFGIE